MTAINPRAVAGRMRSALESAGLDDGDLAVLLDEKTDTVIRWLDGEEEPSGPDFIRALAAIRDITGACPYWIITGKTWVGGDRRLN